MNVQRELEFGHDDRERIYDYVERHGECTFADLETNLRVDPRGIRHHVAILRRDGYLEVDGDAIEVVFDDGTAEEYRDGEVEFVVRPAHQSDLTGLIGAIRQVAEEGRYIEAESVADVIDHEEVLLRHNELEERMFFVATVGSDVVGWVHVAGSELDKLQHTAELTVGVIDNYRGHGIGSHLLERGLEWAGSRGYEKIYNSIPASNDDAIAFLENHGWAVEATREDHYKLGDQYVDEVMMDVRL
ncbi:GNAT family N-acetyltransferase [Halobacterium bonnevillei]|uniref:GNAT family N-acetyltransferase n=1 Tax=Halobacterium bonnevillei TaxID=2692200 RepID=A0A6B0SIC5_9EURY|nr:GNAT family N-acetyltransferase [Halobacterium bonnevillei]MXR20837.1 GNAT family N-acetyltransferase [Halobacterium bonnevillei]